MPGYMDTESPYSGNYGSVCAPAELGGRGVDSWRILDGIPNAAGVTRAVVGPLLPEEGMAAHYYKEYWGVAAPGPQVECKWGVPVTALDSVDERSVSRQEKSVSDVSHKHIDL